MTTTIAYPQIVKENGLRRAWRATRARALL